MRPRLPLTLGWGRTVPVVLQAEAAECGLACLAMIAGYHGYESDIGSLRFRFAASLRGVTLAQLMGMAAELKLSPRAVRLEPPALSQLRAPCILHWELDHFVVLERASNDRIQIIDPAIGRRTVPVAEVAKRFTGVALELTPAQDFAPGQAQAKLTLRPFLQSIKGLPKTLLTLFAFSLSLQAFALVMPLFTQWVVDEVIGARAQDLLTVLIIGFGTILALNVLFGATRSFFLLRVGLALQFEWAVRVFRHLIRLPLAYFERRHMADVLSRFRSLQAIQGLVTNTMVEAWIDGIMALTTVIVMLVYSPRLALISFVALGLYALVRLSVYRAQREAAQEVLIQSARESGHFLESLRGILAIKSFGKEPVRETTWQNREADSIRASYRTAMYSTVQQIINQSLFGIENLLVLYFGAQAVITGGFSVGMLIAFLAYKGLFTSRSSALIDKLMEFRLASVHFDRLADIVLEEPDAGSSEAAHDGSPLSGRIEVRDLCFRYATTEPYVLENLNLTIHAGECVAISGASGRGKSTLIKLLSGLLWPDRGEILADGRDIFKGALGAYRWQVAAVMQDDVLLSGTLSDNIAFFDPQPDRERIERCAQLAAIHDDIVRMPMGYLTLVGDMGAALSGGQRQRILLARALYGQPRVLLLDEATSHVDAATERRIHEALAGLAITRIFVAHRRETQTLANRVISLDEMLARDQNEPILRAYPVPRFALSGESSG